MFLYRHFLCRSWFPWFNLWFDVSMNGSWIGSVVGVRKKVLATDDRVMSFWWWEWHQQPISKGPTWLGSLPVGIREMRKEWCVAFSREDFRFPLWVNMAKQNKTNYVVFTYLFRISLFIHIFFVHAECSKRESPFCVANVGEHQVQRTVVFIKCIR